MRKVLLIGSTAAAILGLGMLWLYMQRYEAEESGGPPVAVLMAQQDIPLGMTLTSDMIGIRDLPAMYVEERHIRAADMNNILGVRVSMGVKATESILWTDIAASGQKQRELSGQIRNGMRAVTIQAERTSAFGGLLRPGDRVDVLLTATRGDEDSGQRVTIPLLQNVTCLAVGRYTQDSLAGDVSRRQERRFNEVTLNTTVDQAQLLTHAQQALLAVYDHHGTVLEQSDHRYRAGLRDAAGGK